MKPIVLGIILMVYPYFVSDGWLLYLIGGCYGIAIYL